MKYRHILIVGLILGLAVVAFGSHPYISNPGTLLDGFENVANWTVYGTGATAANDANFFKQGSQSIKVYAYAGNVAEIEKSNIALDLSIGDGFSIWYFVADSTKLASLSFDISSYKNNSKRFHIALQGSRSGWNQRVYAKSEFTNVGDESWNNTMVRMRLRFWGPSGEDVSVSFDDLRYGLVGQPKVILTFDDGKSSIADKAYPIMAANGQKGVAFVNSSYIDTSNYMTLANLQTLKAAGWDISNHTAAHLKLTTVSQEEMEADIDGGYDWLVANGFGNTARFFAYPDNVQNDAVIAYVKQRHVLARTSSYFNYHFDILNFEGLQYLLGQYNVDYIYGVDVNAVEARINQTVEKSGLLILLFHQIVDADPATGKYSTADFQAITDYLKTMQDAGLLEVITFSDYYNALIKWHRLEPEPFCPEMDFNGDCKVDFKDLAIFMQSWLKCNIEPKSACWE